jgi:hypothetical protein
MLNKQFSTLTAEQEGLNLFATRAERVDVVRNQKVRLDNLQMLKGITDAAIALNECLLDGVGKGNLLDGVVKF